MEKANGGTGPLRLAQMLGERKKRCHCGNEDERDEIDMAVILEIRLNSISRRKENIRELPCEIGWSRLLLSFPSCTLPFQNGVNRLA